MKTCTKCNVMRSLSEFTKASKAPDGLSHHCKPCVKEKAAQYYLKNKERVLERNKEWQRENPDKKNAIARRRRSEKSDDVLAYQREWREKNREKVNGYASKWRGKVGNGQLNEAARIYREANREKTRQAALKWQKENPGKANAQNAARYAAKLRATPKWADLESIERLYIEAERITKETGIRHDVDHIVPLRSKVVSGLHCEANLRVMPAADNRSKGNRWWPDMP